MLKVEVGALDTAAADIGTRANQIEARLNQLDADLAPLRADWTGEASAAYQSAKATWTRAISTRGFGRPRPWAMTGSSCGSSTGSTATRVICPGAAIRNRGGCWSAK